MKSIFLLLGILGATSASANYLAFTPPSSFSPGTGSSNNPVNLGLFFDVTSSITVDELGFYDIPNLTVGETVTLYTSTGTALTSVFVPLTAALNDGYYMVSITPYVLTPGEYTVVAFTGNNPWEYGTTPTLGAGITYVGPNYAYASSPTFPSGGISQPAGSYYGPTFDVATTSSVPEPGTWGVLAGGLGLLLFGRRCFTRFPRT
jgi:hypothetical protein